MESGAIKEVPELAGEETPQPVSENSFLDKLREQRKKLGGQHTNDFSVPGYNDELVVRYKYVEWEELRKVADKAMNSKSPLRELFAQCDTLSLACDEIFVRKDGGLIPMSEVAELDEPVRYDHNLAEVFDIKTNSVRQLIRALFNNDLAITGHHAEVIEWLQGTSSEVDDEYMGESQGQLK